ncbi:non-ribosomal peptide synthetase [Deinococcus roseus]|uniref:Carrier domain-containing protein n=1 Tax=Deinococcus roseus TaxID=392414 RepID=A0ABQ2D390_9DEIO|nr:non-ribosomal peptide synthetase [Deinococcus roseus]GGJ42835.1 hypothetical protein GCM10008938_31320 [Deinococcus roseus]
MEHLLADLKKRGIRLSLQGDRLDIQAPRGALSQELRTELLKHREKLLALLRTARNTPALDVQALVSRPAERFQPFPLTDLQHAYWLGRAEGLEGNTATHFYLELDCQNLDVARLQTALRQLIQHHDMLRAVVDPSGMQRVLPEVEPYQILVQDFSGFPTDEAEQRVLQMREALSHRVCDPAVWPLFEVQVTHLPAGHDRLHFSMDMLFFDLGSLLLFFEQWKELYQQPHVHASLLPETPGPGFRDWVEQGRGVQPQSRTYWTERLDSLPAAPGLPLRLDPQARKAPRFARRQFRLPQESWEILKARALQHGLTPSGFLLAVYAEVLSRWSHTAHFTLNVTLVSQRPATLEGVAGNFTSVVLHEVDHQNPQLRFVDFARQVQQQLLSDLQHADFSGVAVLREWSKQRGTTLQAAMPVVFTSGLGKKGRDAGCLEGLGRQVFGITQTAQVWLDQQVMEVHGDLLCIWDAAEKVFEPGVLDEMFRAQHTLLLQLLQDETLWDIPDPLTLPAPQDNTPAFSVPLPESPLHADFVRQALEHPERVALISGLRTLTYGELLAAAVFVADQLQDVPAGEPVAVLMHRGWEQVVAVLGVLQAGGAYLPIEASLPLKRQRELLQISQTRHVLTQPSIEHEVPAGPWKTLAVQAGQQSTLAERHQKTLHLPLDQLAYIIFTSGTTGVPKGVMVDHRGASNTIQSINQMFQVGPEDRILMVSSLAFDLSVYDLFGLLGAGGAVVLPDADRHQDPMHWQDLLQKHQVTLWNSAPQLMQMLTSTPHTAQLSRLRTVLLSGDFIPLDLPDRIRAQHPQAQVVSLGGATEASIWSIFHPIGQVDPTWSSIPYGKALPNQSMQVLDAWLRPCPELVQGQIFIGGIGLAKGYWQDEEKTAARFIHHPRTGERLYDTGDLGHLDREGRIRIAGRADQQIKLRGHRIEPAEIEAVLQQHPAVRQAQVVLQKGPSEGRQLVAFIETSATDPHTLRQHLTQHLPDFMVPRHLVLLDQLPVSGNGKLDRQKLLDLASHLESGPEHLPPRNATEQQIFAIWQEVFVGMQFGVTDSFFDLGGDSVMATRLVRDLNACLPDFQLEMHDLFEHITVAELADFYQNQREVVLLEEVHTPQAAHSETQMLSDVQEAVLQMEGFDFGLPAREHARQPRHLLLTGATGWVGAHVLFELLLQTRATVSCLVRASHLREGQQRLMAALQRHGLMLHPGWQQRIEVVCGDLDAPMLGLERPVWERLAAELDGIYHLGASLNLMVRPHYADHRQTNTLSALTLTKLATQIVQKPLFFLSPMTVGRRYHQGQFEVLHEEKSYGPQGLMTGYAQSKWAAEQVLLAAARRELPVRIYRTSHALPSSNGHIKPEDTYWNVLRVACQTGVIPEWEHSRLNGMPVDILARLLVEDTLSGDVYRGIIHLDNHHPLSIQDILQAMLGREAPVLPLQDWLELCRQKAEMLPDVGAALARWLFAEQNADSTVQRMFFPHPIDTTHFTSRQLESRLSHLTPTRYWQQLGAQLKGLQT